jgi:hypothetical protein
VVRVSAFTPMKYILKQVVSPLVVKLLFGMMQGMKLNFLIPQEAMFPL